MALTWLRQYPHLDFLAVHFGLPTHTISDDVYRVVGVGSKFFCRWLEMAASDGELEAEIDRTQAMKRTRFREMVVIVDGAEFSIVRPCDPEYARAHYSVKKKQFSLNVLFFVSCDGQLLWFCGPYDHAHDQACWLESGMRARFENRSCGIGGDGGFFFNPATRADSDPPVLGFEPHRATSKRALTASQRVHNTELSQTRVVVENVIGLIKRWGCMGSVFRHYHPGHPGPIQFLSCLNFVGGLTRERLQKRPLRAADWAVPDAASVARE